jgi:ribosome modulation factor
MSRKESELAIKRINLKLPIVLSEAVDDFVQSQKVNSAKSISVTEIILEGLRKFLGEHKFWPSPNQHPAFLQGERAARDGRDLDGCPYPLADQSTVGRKQYDNQFQEFSKKLRKDQPVPESEDRRQWLLGFGYGQKKAIMASHRAELAAAAPALKREPEQLPPWTGGLGKSGKATPLEEGRYARKHGMQRGAVPYSTSEAGRPYWLMGWDCEHASSSEPIESPIDELEPEENEEGEDLEAPSEEVAAAEPEPAPKYDPLMDPNHPDYDPRKDMSRDDYKQADDPNSVFYTGPGSRYYEQGLLDEAGTTKKKKKGK